MKCFTFSGLFVVVLLFQASRSIKLEQKYRWKEVSFAWPSEAAKDEAISSGQYKISNNLPLGLDVWKDKLFITVPRYGFPSTQSIESDFCHDIV